MSTARRGYRYHRDGTVAGNRDTQIGSAVGVVKAGYDTAAAGGPTSSNGPSEPCQLRPNRTSPSSRRTGHHNERKILNA